jgi:hypothetical protein
LSQDGPHRDPPGPQSSLHGENPSDEGNPTAGLFPGQTPRNVETNIGPYSQFGNYVTFGADVKGDVYITDGVERGRAGPIQAFLQPPQLSLSVNRDSKLYLDIANDSPGDCRVDVGVSWNFRELARIEPSSHIVIPGNESAKVLITLHIPADKASTLMAGLQELRVLIRVAEKSKPSIELPVRVEMQPFSLIELALTPTEQNTPGLSRNIVQYDLLVQNQGNHDLELVAKVKSLSADLQIRLEHERAQLFYSDGPPSANEEKNHQLDPVLEEHGLVPFRHSLRLPILAQPLGSAILGEHVYDFRASVQTGAASEVAQAGKLRQQPVISQDLSGLVCKFVRGQDRCSDQALGSAR